MSISEDLLRRAAESLLRRGGAFLAEEIFTHLGRTCSSAQELWDVQLRNYPESVELTNQQMFRWADGPEDYRGEARSRWRAIALSLNQGGGFFYITDAENGFVGYRYGMDNSEYMSGFGQGWHFKLVDGVLIEVKG